MKKTLEQLYDGFTTHLVTKSGSAFLIYVLQQDKVKKFVLSKFNLFYDSALENDNCGFFVNNCYIYLFKNKNDCNVKLELKKVFDCFFDISDSDHDIDLKLEHI